MEDKIHIQSTTETQNCIIYTSLYYISVIFLLLTVIDREASARFHANLFFINLLCIGHVIPLNLTGLKVAFCFQSLTYTRLLYL